MISEDSQERSFPLSQHEHPEKTQHNELYIRKPSKLNYNYSTEIRAQHTKHQQQYWICFLWFHKGKLLSTWSREQICGYSKQNIKKKTGLYKNFTNWRLVLIFILDTWDNTSGYCSMLIQVNPSFATQKHKPAHAYWCLYSIVVTCLWSQHMNLCVDGQEWTLTPLIFTLWNEKWPVHGQDELWTISQS